MMSAASSIAARSGPARRLVMSLLAACTAALLLLGQSGAALADPPAASPAATQPANTPDQQRLENVILAAKQYLGVPYRVGTEGPSLFDCSGLVFRAFSDVGLVDRIGGARLRAAGYMRWFASRGLMTADESQAQRGDLVIYNGGTHIGIFLGDGRVISALTNPFGVTVHSLHGVGLPVTGFLRPDWSGKGEVPPFVPVNLPDVPEAPVTLVQGADWMPALDSSVTAPAQRDGKEVVELRTPNSRTFANADGTYTTEFHAQPIFYQPAGTTDRADLAPIDLTFSADAKTDSATVASSPVVITTRPADDADGFISAVTGDFSVSLGLATQSGIDSSKSVPMVVEGGRVVDYFDLQPQHVGLRVAGRTDGFKSFIVLNKATDQNRFSFVLDAPGLTAALADDGSIALSAADGLVVGRLPAPVLLDSSDVDGNGGGVFTSAASWSLDTTGDAPVLTAVIDRDYLEEAVLPAFLDVSLVGFGGAAPGADVTFVSSTHPNANLTGLQRPESAGYDELWLGHQPNTRNDNAVLLRFNGLAALLGTVDVASASLELLPYLQKTANGATVVRRATSDWSASSVTWLTQPTADDEDALTVTTEGGAWSTIDVSAYMTDVLSRGMADYGLVLSGDGSAGTSWKRLAGSDAGGNAEFGPRLVVTWSGLRPSALPADPAAAGTLSWASPSFAAPQARYQVEISDDGFATAATASGTVKGQAGKAASWSVPPDALGDGAYEWRVRVKYGTDTAWSPWSTPASLTVGVPALSGAGDGVLVPHGAVATPA
jgi:cell wall-associated NlpC family hydrolase